jgi:hypothetical protein
MHGTFRMLFVKLLTGTPLLDVMRARQNLPRFHIRSRSTYVTDEMNHGQQAGTVFVARNQAERLRQQTTKLGNVVKAGRGFNNTGRVTL